MLQLARRLCPGDTPAPECRHPWASAPQSPAQLAARSFGTSQSYEILRVGLLPASVCQECGTQPGPAGSCSGHASGEPRSTCCMHLRIALGGCLHRVPDGEGIHKSETDGSEGGSTGCFLSTPLSLKQSIVAHHGIQPSVLRSKQSRPAGRDRLLAVKQCANVFHQLRLHQSASRTQDNQPDVSPRYQVVQSQLASQENDPQTLCGAHASWRHLAVKRCVSTSCGTQAASNYNFNQSADSCHQCQIRQQQPSTPWTSKFAP